MRKWEEFEDQSVVYLNRNFRNTQVKFVKNGGTNSNTTDIKVTKGNDYLFSIEVKYSPSQSGQFVIAEENNEYSLSSESKFENNEYTKKIIDHLNDNRLTYSPKGQAAININLEKHILASWVKNHYIGKDSFFIITATKLNSYKAIVPIEELGTFFNVSACIRRKRSGTRDIGISRVEEALDKLSLHLRGINLELKKRTEEKGRSSMKTLVEFNNKEKLTHIDQYFGEDFFLSPKPNTNGYYIKVRAKTNNLNVIFSLSYKGPENNTGLDKLGNFILDNYK